MFCVTTHTHPRTDDLPEAMAVSRQEDGGCGNDRTDNIGLRVRRTGGLLQFDAKSWGWIHLLLGLLVLFAGFAVLAGQTWGRVVGITLAVLSALANFAFLPYYPFWAMTTIALDIFVIWALAVHGREPTT